MQNRRTRQISHSRCWPALVLCLLASCGQTGALYLPDSKLPTSQNSQPVSQNEIIDRPAQTEPEAPDSNDD